MFAFFSFVFSNLHIFWKAISEQFEHFSMNRTFWQSFSWHFYYKWVNELFLPIFGKCLSLTKKDVCLRTCMQIFLHTRLLQWSQFCADKKKNVPSLKTQVGFSPILDLCTRLLISLRMQYSPESLSKHIFSLKIK